MKHAHAYTPGTNADTKQGTAYAPYMHSHNNILRKSVPKLPEAGGLKPATEVQVLLLPLLL